MNVASMLTRAARENPSAPGLSDADRTLTYAEFHEQASRLGSAFRRAGLEPGDRVAIWMRNRIEYLIALFGVFRAGLVAVPINAKLHPNEVGWILENAEAGGLVTDSGALSAPVVVRADDGWDAFLAAGEPHLADADTAPDDLAWLFFTSGTTGFPKGAMLSHRNLLAFSMSALADMYNVRSDDVVLHPAPLSHGCGLYLLAATARGARHIVHGASSFDPREVLELIQRERVTSISFMAPTQLVRLLECAADVDTSSLRCITYGGAPILSDQARAAFERFGPVLYQSYGQGEAPAIASLRPDEHTGATLGSAGRPRANVEVKAVDGQIVVRGDVVTAGYWRNPEATDGASRNGWWHTGDLGRMDEHGVIYLDGRKGDVIISGGTNIYPGEVENVLIEHPGVHDVSVFGVPDREWGENVVAAIVPVDRDAVDADDVRTFCKQRLASFKKPRDVVFVDALPRNAYGKVLRQELRDGYRAPASGGTGAIEGRRKTQ